MGQNTLFRTILLVSLVLCACGTDDLRSEEDEGLVVYPLAKDISYSKVKGTSQVRYLVAETYPAKKTLDWLSSELSRKGWRPLNYDFLDPGIKLSDATGWMKFGDVRTSVDYQVHQWLANWEHPSGSVVRYELQYRYPKGSQPDLTTLNVAGVYIPAKLAREMRKLPK